MDLDLLNFLLDDPGSDFSAIESLMNGVIRNKLKIIPDTKKWTLLSPLVSNNMAGDFMKPRINEVDELLKKGVNVTIYNGQLDVICATIGTEAWVKKLKWEELETYLSMNRTPIYCVEENVTKGFRKSYKNLDFYWILEAGHNVSQHPCHW
ncbi:putative carboxypeptidase C [Helianthus debilis subsp. tardiflorus]